MLCFAALSHLWTCLYEKNTEHSIYVEVSRLFKVSGSTCRRKNLSPDKKPEMSIWKETREHDPLRHKGHIDINAADNWRRGKRVREICPWLQPLRLSWIRKECIWKKENKWRDHWASTFKSKQQNKSGTAFLVIKEEARSVADLPNPLLAAPLSPRRGGLGGFRHLYKFPKPLAVGWSHKNRWECCKRTSSHAIGSNQKRLYVGSNFQLW